MADALGILFGLAVGAVMWRLWITKRVNGKLESPLDSIRRINKVGKLRSQQLKKAGIYWQYNLVGTLWLVGLGTVEFCLTQLPLTPVQGLSLAAGVVMLIAALLIAAAAVDKLIKMDDAPEEAQHGDN